MNTENYKIYQGDCLEVMKTIPDGSIDMVLCDLPFEVTDCEWDRMIPFDKLWKQYNRIVKENGAVVLFGIQPFTTKMIMSNLKYFKYEIIWEKENGTNFANAKKQTLRNHENICIFYRKQPTYNPQFRKGKPYVAKRKRTERNIKVSEKGVYGKGLRKGITTVNDGKRYPKSVWRYKRDKMRIHPTQKPILLLGSLIRTFTNENEVVLDNTMGSGSTGVAALKNNRKFIGIEQNLEYFTIAKERLERIK